MPWKWTHKNCLPPKGTTTFVKTFHLSVLVPRSEGDANEARKGLMRSSTLSSLLLGNSQHAWLLDCDFSLAASCSLVHGLPAGKENRRKWPGPARKGLICHVSLFSRGMVSESKLSFWNIPRLAQLLSRLVPQENCSWCLCLKIGWVSGSPGKSPSYPVSSTPLEAWTFGYLTSFLLFKWYTFVVE